MTRFVVCLVCCFISLTAFSQSLSCDCAANLDTLIEKTMTNYAGYPTKVTTTTATEYKSLVQDLKRQAAKQSDPKTCYYILRAYVRFFKDKHFIVSFNCGGDYDSTIIHFDEGYWKRAFKNKTLTKVEGIWTNPDSTITIGILKNKDRTYQAVKINSKVDSLPRGFVYFNLDSAGSHFIAKEYNAFMSTSTPAKLKGNLLQLWSHGMWGRTYPQSMTTKERLELATWKHNNNGLSFQKIHPDVSYLKVPSFFNTDNQIQQLVAANDSLIRHTKYLVVDLRGNGGGNNGWIYFLPYFMTNPIKQPVSMLRVTPDNVRRKLPELAMFVENPISEEYRKYFPEEVLNAYKKAYYELPTTREPFYPIPSVRFPLDSVTRNPKKIALIVDNMCGSSTEFFFYLSKQSNKTTTYGTNTIGMMDYEGMSNPTAMPFNRFIVTIPIAKSGWTDKHPIDLTGFTPDVKLNLPEENWIDVIVDDLRKR